MECSSLFLPAGDVGEIKSQARPTSEDRELIKCFIQLLQGFVARRTGYLKSAALFSVHQTTIYNYYVYNFYSIYI